MNQNFYNYNSFDFDKFQPPQFPVIHQPPQQTSVEILQAKEDLMNSIETFLKKFNRISFRETPKVLLLAWEKFFKIKHREKQHPPEEVQELLNKLLEDMQNISEELAEFINSPSWSRPTFYLDDDEDLTLFRQTESTKIIKFSVENLVPIPSESKVTSDNKMMTSHFLMRHPKKFSEIYSNPLFDEEIISDKIDASIISSPKIDSLLEQFSGELAHIDPIPPGIEKVDFDLEEEIRFVKNLLYDNSSPRPLKELNSTESFPPIYTSPVEG
ncbi:hypothetical protein Tco_0868175 [Tanacetum coccineum]